MYVIDASVAVKWFLQEQGSSEAELLRSQFLAGEADFAAPDLLVYEVVNTLICKRTLDGAEVRQAADSLLTMEMTLWVPDVEFMSRAVHWAGLTGASIYDASYVALADLLDWELVTADRRLATMAGSHVKIRMLNMF